MAVNKENLVYADTQVNSTLLFSQACENNKQPILNILQKELADSTYVLEIGSGTGQHSVYFAPQLGHLKWQTSDVVDNHLHIKAWHAAYPTANLYPPLAFDLADDCATIYTTTKPLYDALFTANTLHIIEWSLVERLFACAGAVLPICGKLIVYGPFNQGGQYSSESNRQFDMMLRERNASSGIRNQEDIVTLAAAHHLSLIMRYQMPANNKMLVFKKTI